MKYLTLLFLLLTNYLSYSQCACMGGAAIGGITAIGGTANLGVLRENYIRFNLFNKYQYGNKFFGNKNFETGLVNYFQNYFTDLRISYGISNKLMLEGNINYFPQKKQSYSERELDTILKDFGFSSYGFGIMYNLYNSILKEIEFTAGIGLNCPFEVKDIQIPQHISSSTGAYSINIKSFLHKGFKKSDLHFFLINRFDYFFENNQTYNYGPMLTSSLFMTKTLINNLSAYIELRNELRDKDLKNGEKVDNTGSSIFYISPQLNYSFDKFNISLFYDFPIYQSFNGSQLGVNYSIGLNITYQTKLIF